MQRFKWIFLLVISISLCGNESYGSDLVFDKGILDLRGKSRDDIKEISIEGEWEFYWNELYAPKDFKDNQQKKHQFITVPGKWNKTLVDGEEIPGQGYATYRAKIIKDSSWNDLAFMCGGIGTAYQLFIDDSLVRKGGRVGREKDDARSGYNPGVVDFKTLKDTIQVIIQVSNYNYYKAGIWDNFMKFGERKSILKAWHSQIQLSLFLIGSILIIAIYHLGLFLLNRTFRYTMYFSLFCLVIVSRIVSVDEILLLQVFNNFNWVALIKVEYAALVVGSMLFSLFIFKFFDGFYSKKFLKVFLTLNTIQLLIILSSNPCFFTRFLFVYQINILVASGYILLVVFKALQNNNNYALILLVGFLMLLFTIVNDMLHSQGVINTTYVTPFGFIAFIISQAFMVSARFSRLFIKSESLAQRLEITNQNLEQLVVRRTSKIQEQNTVLIEQSDEIQNKNNALESQNDEIKSQRDYLQQQNKLVLKQKRQITSSIEYASRIQGAVIDKSNEISSVAPDNFIFFQPKDIVSGDFYWFKEIVINEKKYKIAAVVDCTGHGVPGAFMSILGALFLNKLSNEFSGSKPKASEILNKLRIEVKSLLHQNVSEKIIKDGMDMSLVIMDYEHMELQFSGAHNPLYIIRNQHGKPACEIEEYKGDLMPIGTYIREKASFTNYTMDMNEGDLVYLFSDGYYDQFGGIDGKKFKKKNFKNLLINIAHLPLNQQKLKLEKNLMEWRSNYDQIDDITVVCIKISEHA